MLFPIHMYGYNHVKSCSGATIAVLMFVNFIYKGN
jgi:hypothetical protein